MPPRGMAHRQREGDALETGREAMERGQHRSESESKRYGRRYMPVRVPRVALRVPEARR